jgi:plasmid stabilization system protein ParE
MTGLRLRWTNPALAAIEEIGAFIAFDRPIAAKRLVSSIFDGADGLLDQPMFGRPGRVAGTRELVVTGTPYILVYRLLSDEIQILAVLHTSRRWPATFD